jgi:hypothetical protein
VVNIGKDLIGAKRYLSHGAFLCWVEAEAGIPARTAQVYMQVAQWVGGKGATVAHLPLTALYLLSARSTPNEFAMDVLNRVQRGETVSLTSLREELKAVRKNVKGPSNREDTAEPIEAKDTISQNEAGTRDHSREFGTDALFGESRLDEIAPSLANKVNESTILRTGGKLSASISSIEPANGEIVSSGSDSFNVPSVLSSASLLAEAANIMVTGLSDADFARVREIMMSNLVLEDPELPQNLTKAFAACLGAERLSHDYHVTTLSA